MNVACHLKEFLQKSNLRIAWFYKDIISASGDKKVIFFVY